jgi:tetratricopeptide (TPR) repeat protein
LTLLEQAADLAQTERNRRAEVDIALSRADIAIAQGDLQNAEWVLNELRQECEQRQHRAPLAYALASQGVIAQKKQDWELARSLYEQARKIATEIRADGAGGRATGHLADIYLEEENASYAIYLLRDAIPRLRRSGDRELLGYFQGRLGVALIQSGHADEGLEAIRVGLEAAYAIRHRSQMRQLLHLLGAELLERGEMVAARQQLEQALTLYTDTPTAQRIQLLCDLSKAALVTGETGAAMRYAQDALKNAEQLNQADLIQRARGMLGLAQLEQGEPDHALGNLEAAVSTESEGAASPSIQRRIARLLIGNNLLEEAETRLKQVIETSRADFPAEAARAMNQLASIHQQRGQFREALTTLQQAETLFESSGMRAEAVHTHCDIAGLYMALGDGRMAQREYDQTMERLSAIHDPEIRGAILVNTANAYSEIGDIDTAEEFYKDAITLAHNAGNRAREARRRGNYGRFLALTDRPHQAIDELQDAIKHSKAANLPIELAVQTGNLALAHAALKDHQEQAFELFADADQQFVALEQPALRAQFLAHRADLYLNHAQLLEATAYFTEALQIATEQHLIVLRIHARLGLAETQLKQGDKQAAQAHLQEIEAAVKRAGLRRMMVRWYEIHVALLDPEQSGAIEAARAEAARLRKIMRMPVSSAVVTG